MSRASVLGVHLDCLTQKESVLRIRALLHTQSCHPVFTVNNEMVVEAQKNHAFRSVLRSASLCLPDSTGVVWALRRQGHGIRSRVTGVDTVLDLCAFLSADMSVFLLGGREGVADAVADILRSQFPALSIVGTYAGSPAPGAADGIIRSINASGARLLLVAYGAPAQELWIHRYLPSLSHVRVAMGVGGTFDFIAGVQRRAPLFLQKIGLEWAWRFVHQPSRWRRMWRAVVVFPFLVIRAGAQSA